MQVVAGDGGPPLRPGAVLLTSRLVVEPEVGETDGAAGVSGCSSASVTLMVTASVFSGMERMYKGNSKAGALGVESMARETLTVSPSLQESPLGSNSKESVLPVPGLGMAKISDPRVRVRGPLPSSPSEGTVPRTKVVEETDGLKLPPRAAEATPEWDTHREADKVLRASGAKVQHVPGGDRAYYRMDEDKIVLPDPSQFATRNGYYQTALHEAGHSTGHHDRMNCGTLKEGLAALTQTQERDRGPSR